MVGCAAVGCGAEFGQIMGQMLENLDKLGKTKEPSQPGNAGLGSQVPQVTATWDPGPGALSDLVR